ncbi:MAG: biopolymer transporter ExbD [Leptolyngbyaceae cyanobacterium CRU_2_3]|nr:biopolymer transporter ExbD [Leptolyngbyaceae cyanobacterium CRU_2_3]
MNISEEDLDAIPPINIVPMIDVIFAILTFFIMSTLFLTRSEGLPVNLPKSATAEMQRQSRITVTIDAKDQVSLNRQPVQVNQLASRIKTVMGKQSQAVVVINADETVRHGQVIAVMDQVRKVNGATIGIATRRP